MSKKIVAPNVIGKIISALKKENKTIVLAGGVFDILHKGHMAFLKKAKEQGDSLLVVLESDEKVKEVKGDNRPINSQLQRASVLSSLTYVDYVILLPYFSSNKDYDSLVETIKPDIIATTKPDPYIFHKERQAKNIGARVVEVIERIPYTSTTELIQKI